MLYCQRVYLYLKCLCSHYLVVVVITNSIESSCIVFGFMLPYEENSFLLIDFFFYFQAFKRELKAKEPVIMSALDTVRIFLTDHPFEGLEKLYHEPRGN